MKKKTKPREVKNFEDLRNALRRFAEDRDWDQFHSPKNLASALIVEAAELLEHFQWLPSGEPSELAPGKLDDIQEELADVLIYLIRLADKLEVDLLSAAQRKLEKNAEKYPIEKARSSSKKYTDF